jgi:hypothetical protein
MLVRFDSKAGSITMFGDVAVNLLRMMGQSGSIPGAILGADIAPALDRLRQAVAGAQPVPEGRSEGRTEGRNERGTKASKTDDEGERPVGIQQRAFPLIELLERAAKQGADVVWETETRKAF